MVKNEEFVIENQEYSRRSRRIRRMIALLNDAAPREYRDNFHRIQSIELFSDIYPIN